MLNKNVSHNLASSAYNTRREGSASALSFAAEQYGVDRSYSSITREMANTCAGKPGEVLYKRYSYILEENQRVLDAAEALQKGDIITLDDLLYKSHLEQRKKHEVSCSKLIFWSTCPWRNREF